MRHRGRDAGPGYRGLTFEWLEGLTSTITDEEQRLYISEAAVASQVEATTIRFYEAEGVLPDPKRTSSGYRTYDPADIELIDFVRRVRALDVGLDDVRQIVQLRTEGRSPCHIVRAAIADTAASIDQRIAELQALRGELRLLETLTRDLPDNWPADCVCHAIETSDYLSVTHAGASS
jgi:DNA-binding transcriptional MerR regulator